MTPGLESPRSNPVGEAVGVTVLCPAAEVDTTSQVWFGKISVASLAGCAAVCPPAPVLATRW